MIADYQLAIASEDAVRLYFHDRNISPHVVKQVAAILTQRFVEPEKEKHPEQAQYWDVVPANNTITLFFNPLYVSCLKVKQAINATLVNTKNIPNIATQNTITTHNIPVFYGGEYALDLNTIAEKCQLSVAQVIELHSSVTYQVTAVGFAPGFAYLNGLPEALRIPRMTKPRKHIVAGSLAIAERQTAVYPCDSPAGWHILGHCPMPLFSIKTGAIMVMGDNVTFSPISQREYQTLLNSNNK